MEGIFEEFISQLVKICLSFDENIWIFPSHTILHIPVRTHIKKEKAIKKNIEEVLCSMTQKMFKN